MKALKSLRRALRRNKKFKPYFIKKTVEGQSFDFYVGSAVGEEWYANESTNSPWAEMRFIRDKLIHKGDTVLECGSHHGCTTILFSRWVGNEGRVFAFEPYPENFAILTENIRINNLKNVQPEMVALGPSDGKVSMRNKSNSSVSVNKKGVLAPMTKLDNFKHTRPSLIKVDVEGYELEVLKGAKEILAQKPNLAIEVHAKSLKKRGAAIADILLKIGDDYSFWAQWDDSEEPKLYKNEPVDNRIHLFAIHPQAQHRA